MFACPSRLEQSLNDDADGRLQRESIHREHTGGRRARQAGNLDQPGTRPQRLKRGKAASARSAATTGPMERNAYEMK